MTIGTRSLLFGAHQFLLHPLFVARAWTALYGFPKDPRLWFVFFFHDIGYWGLSEIDGPIGDRHPIRGALIIRRLFGPQFEELTKYHSRTFAQAENQPVSKLCFADKYAVTLTPWWIYLPLATLTGELDLYMKSSLPGEKHADQQLSTLSAKAWYLSLQDYFRGYVTASAFASVITHLKSDK